MNNLDKILEAGFEFKNTNYVGYDVYGKELNAIILYDPRYDVIAFGGWKITDCKHNASLGGEE